jgi:site-specific recombinase XerD
MQALKMALGHSTFEMADRYLHIVQADLDDVHRTASPVTNWFL